MPGPPNCTFHDLGEDLREWGVLELVVPLFASDVPWAVSIPRGRPPAAAAEERVEFDNLKRMFKINIGSLPDLLPDKTLSENEFRVCENSLRPLLVFLESVVLGDPGSALASAPVAGEDDETEEGRKMKEEKSMKIRAWTNVLVPGTWATTGRAILNSMSTYVAAAVGFKQATSTATSVRRGTAAGSTAGAAAGAATTTSNIDKLRALGELVREDDGTSMAERCRPYLRLELGLEELRKATENAESIADVFRDAASPEAQPGGQEVSETNWTELRPRQVSSQLFYLLRERTCRPMNQFFHRAKLQLDGFLLDSLNEPVRLDIFLSSCPPPPPTWWRRGWYTSVTSRENRRNALDLCKIMGNSASRSPPILKMFFQEGKLYHDERYQDGRPAPQESAPTMSLAELLERGVLLLESSAEASKGLFTLADKAILALSLARCLLHLFRSSWMHEMWTADNVHFLHQPGDSGDWIFDIHHPYVTCSLGTSIADDEPQWQANGCQTFLSAFAKLLVEIEAGRQIAVDVNQTHETFRNEMWQYVRELEVSRHGNAIGHYIQAVHGCLNFGQALARQPRARTTGRRRNGAEEPAPLTFGLEQVREIIYTKVVKNLEQHYASFPTTTTVFHSGGLLVLGTMRESVGIAAATLAPPTLLSTAEYRRIDFYRYFGFCSKKTSAVIANFDETARRAENFERMFRQFRERFIEPKMKKLDPEEKNGHDESRSGEQRSNARHQQPPRIRIALLDTGIHLKHADLETERKKVKRYRSGQNFEGQDIEPIKTRKSFVKEDTKIWDQCGHGTHLALLLLRYAPDADLYIAKVSSNMEFNDKNSIINAIKWATGDEVKADIISMSFGCDLVSTSVHDAIKDTQKTTGATGHTPLLFAAASNHGLLKCRSFPASDVNVICVYALDGEGFDVGQINPPTDPDKANFGTLGHGIELSWEAADAQAAAAKTNGEAHPAEPGGDYRSGTSYATPILAATVANYLAWLDCHAAELGANRHKRAREMEWVVKVLRNRMSQKKETASDLMFVQPWCFFDLQGCDLRDQPAHLVRELDAVATRRCLNEIESDLKAVDD